MRPSILLLLVMPAFAFSQWLNYPATGVPRTRDGKVNRFRIEASLVRPTTIALRLTKCAVTKIAPLISVSALDPQT
jgi:hypothetical protein